MKRAERSKAVLSLVTKQGEINPDESTSKLQILPTTARRDLDARATQQLLARTRGGAVSQSVGYHLPLRYNDDQHAPEKLLVGHAASALARHGHVIGLSSGTTNTAVASAPTSRSGLMEPSAQLNPTVPTNAINITLQFTVRPQIKTVATGGVGHPRPYEPVGPYSDVVLEKTPVDITFIGVNGINPVLGTSVHDEREASIKSLMASRATRAVVAADSSKIVRRAFASLGPASPDTLITDIGITQQQLEAFAGRGIKMVVA